MKAEHPPSCAITDPQSLPARIGTPYPPHLDEPCAKRIRRALGNAVGLQAFGVNLTELPPGAWSSQRHWHTRQDEFVYVLEGEITLVTDSGETLLKPGMCAGFPAGKADGHHLINKTDRTARYLDIGDRPAGDAAHYPDVDMAVRYESKSNFTRRNGEPFS
jgi:uncharacterized cupin superfamily protein